ncbi:hypothetical protein ACWDQ0_37130 [Streptomyces sp. NPDC003642]
MLRLLARRVRTVPRGGHVPCSAADAFPESNTGSVAAAGQRLGEVLVPGYEAVYGVVVVHGESNDLALEL